AISPSTPPARIAGAWPTTRRSPSARTSRSTNGRRWRWGSTSSASPSPTGRRSPTDCDASVPAPWPLRAAGHHRGVPVVHVAVLHDVATVGRMDDLPAADVEADVLHPVVEDQVAGVDGGQRDVRGRA